MHVAEFLQDASDQMPIDLEVELQTMLATFERVLKEQVLQQHANMFDLGHYADAEGDATRGLMRISILVMKLEVAHGSELGRVAKQAYHAERDRQTAILEKIHLRSFEVLSIQALQETDGFQKQVHTIAQYLEMSYERYMAMNRVPNDSERSAQYASASKRINDEVRSLVVSEFTPLFKEDTFLEMTDYHVNYLDALCVASSPSSPSLLFACKPCLARSPQAGSHAQRALQGRGCPHAAATHRRRHVSRGGASKHRGLSLSARC